MEINKKTMIMGALVLVATLLIINLASAVFWACFDYGEKVDYCEGYKPSWTCSESGGCDDYCMSEYRADENCYVHGRWSDCNSLPKDQDCNSFGGNTTIDSQPPEFNLLSITEGQLFTDRKVLLGFSLDEKADVYYYDLGEDRGRWTRVCLDCPPGNPSYSRTRSFDEGLNNLTFRATDVIGNPTFLNISFFVDSTDPRIYRTEPRKGFSDGTFEVQFKEENADSLVLHYGNSTEMKEHALDLTSGGDCYFERNKYYCDTNVDLEFYDGREIEYWFSLEDIAGNMDESRHYSLSVDTTDPVINNDNTESCQPDSFWCQGEDRYNRYVYFNINITEENFDEAFYSYVDSRGKVRERRLCSRLKDGICEKKVSFTKGHHDITVTVVDEAGNSKGVGVSFDVV